MHHSTNQMFSSHPRQEEAHTVPPPVPPKPDVPIFSLSPAPPSYLESHASYRNSLVAVDHHTGAVIGMVANDVKLVPSLRVPTTPERPASRLREDSFSPPPLPSKQPRKIQVTPSEQRESVASTVFFSSQEDADEGSEEEAEGYTSLRGRGAQCHQANFEVHQPELLRDLYHDREEAPSNMSERGSVGPYRRKWRWGAAQKKRQQGDRPNGQDEGNDAATAMNTWSSDALSTASLHTASDEISEAGSLSTIIIGDFVPDTIAHDEARDEEQHLSKFQGELSIRSEYQSNSLAGPRRQAVSHTISRRPHSTTSTLQGMELEPLDRSTHQDYIQGGTVLLEFLGAENGRGSIRASLLAVEGDVDVHNRESSSPDSQAVGEESATSHLMHFLVPAMPLQSLKTFLFESQLSGPLIRYWTGDGNASTPSVERTGMDDTQGSIWSGVAAAALHAPYSLYTWLTGSPYGPLHSEDGHLSQEQNGRDPDDGEGEWALHIPPLDPDSLDSTPRPVYRRKRPHPSYENGFMIGGGDDADHQHQHIKTVARYSIVHYDDMGTVRETFLRRDTLRYHMGYGGGL